MWTSPVRNAVPRVSRSATRDTGTGANGSRPAALSATGIPSTRWIPPTVVRPAPG